MLSSQAFKMLNSQEVYEGGLEWGGGGGGGNNYHFPGLKCAQIPLLSLFFGPDPSPSDRNPLSQCRWIKKIHDSTKFFNTSFGRLSKKKSIDTLHKWRRHLNNNTVLYILSLTFM